MGVIVGVKVGVVGTVPLFPKKVTTLEAGSR
jgi:hypothetical protein